MGDEERLPGGNLGGAVRVGDTVRRTVGPWTPSVHSLLDHLADAGFVGAPRVLGFDDQGREILTYLAGEVVGDQRPWPEWTHSEEALVQTADWMRRYHRAVADFVPAPGSVWWGGRSWEPGLVIAHNDAAAYNAAWRDDRLVGFFDWDLAGPATPEWDLAYAAFSWVSLHSRAVLESEGFTAFDERPGRLRRFLAAYGWDGDAEDFVGIVTARVADHAASLRRLAAQGDPVFVRLVAEGHATAMDVALAELSDLDFDRKSSTDVRFRPLLATGHGSGGSTVRGVQVIRSEQSCPRPEQGSAVTIGAYDGVHLGHQAVIAEVRRRAEAAGLASAVVTFDRHPAMVVRPESAPLLLTDLDQKLELLEATGVDYALVVRFDAVRAVESPEDFVKEVIVGCLNARQVVVGEDFHFGHERRGNVELLRRIGSQAGFEVDGIALVGADGTAVDGSGKVSSTQIRLALRDGDTAAAKALLGRSHEVRGLVAHGDERGRELGFPTANVAVPGDILLPADGIYAGWFLRADGVPLPTAINLGRRPTFYEQAHASLLEAHVLDFDGDLYDEHVRVRFVARLHGEVKYESVDALVAGIQRDCEDARAILGLTPFA